MTRVLVVSPHLDDAVYSAGQFLAGRPGAVVVTMFAGAPDPPVIGTDWDNGCGFADSQEAMPARIKEDNAALALLNAIPVQLGFLDQQYTNAPTDPSTLVNAIIEQVEQHSPEFVVGPLGLRHSDHVRVRKAVLAAEVDVPLWLYGDLPYRKQNDAWLQDALQEISSDGYSLDGPTNIGTGPSELKREAVECYVSQTRFFAKIVDDAIMVPELFWRVT